MKCSSSSLKAYGVFEYYSNSSIGGALKRPSKNRLFCIDIRQYIEIDYARTTTHYKINANQYI